MCLFYIYHTIKFVIDLQKDVLERIKKFFLSNRNDVEFWWHKASFGRAYWNLFLKTTEAAIGGVL